MAQLTNILLRRRELTFREREALAGYAFILPTYLGFLIFILLPLLAAAGISLTKFDILGSGTKFIGLANYAKMLTDVRLRTVYMNTVVFTVFAVTFNTVVGLVLAVLLNQRLPTLMRNIYRSVFFLLLEPTRCSLGSMA